MGYCQDIVLSAASTASARGVEAGCLCDHDHAKAMARARDPRVHRLKLELADGALNCNVLVNVHHGGDAKEIGALEL
jgi:hypothetical protein